MPDPTGRLSIIPDMIRGFSWKQPCRVATTANITLSGTQTIDGVACVAGDRVLVKNQTTGSQNGIWIVASGAWIREFDMDQDLTSSVPAEEVLGAVIYVIAGTTNGGKLFRSTNTTAPTLGTTSLTFTEIGASATLTIKDEGSSLATAATSLDFVGAGVTASGTGAAKTITIPGGAATLDDLTDVVITSPALADRLRYNGSSWVNSALIWQPLTNGDAGSPELVFDAGDVIMLEA